MPDDKSFDYYLSGLKNSFSFITPLTLPKDDKILPKSFKDYSIKHYLSLDQIANPDSVISTQFDSDWLIPQTTYQSLSKKDNLDLIKKIRFGSLNTDPLPSYRYGSNSWNQLITPSTAPKVVYRFIPSDDHSRVGLNGQARFLSHMGWWVAEGDPVPSIRIGERKLTDILKEIDMIGGYESKDGRAGLVANNIGVKGVGSTFGPNGDYTGATRLGAWCPDGGLWEERAKIEAANATRFGYLSQLILGENHFTAYHLLLRTGLQVTRVSSDVLGSTANEVLVMNTQAVRDDGIRTCFHNLDFIPQVIRELGIQWGDAISSRNIATIDNKVVAVDLEETVPIHLHTKVFSLSDEDRFVYETLAEDDAILCKSLGLFHSGGVFKPDSKKLTRLIREYGFELEGDLQGKPSKLPSFQPFSKIGANNLKGYNKKDPFQNDPSNSINSILGDDYFNQIITQIMGDYNNPQKYSKMLIPYIQSGIYSREERARAMLFILYNQHLALSRAREALSAYVKEYLDQTAEPQTISEIRTGLHKVMRGKNLDRIVEINAGKIFINADLAEVGKNRAFSRKLRGLDSGNYPENERYNFWLPVTTTLFKRELTDGDIYLALEHLDGSYRTKVNAPRMEFEHCLQNVAQCDLYDHSLLPYISDALLIGALSIRESKGRFSTYSLELDDRGVLFSVVGAEEGARIGEAARDFTEAFSEKMRARFSELGINQLQYDIDGLLKVSIDEFGVVASWRPDADFSANKPYTKVHTSTYAVYVMTEAVLRKKEPVSLEPMKVFLN